MTLSKDLAVEADIRDLMAKPSTAALETLVSTMQRQAGAVSFARRQGVSRYADLVALGAPEQC
jgi:hypothetical protein